MNIPPVCRYVLRPPFAQERLRLRSDGCVVLELKTAWHDGTRELVFEPLEFLERLAAMTPRPETNLLICHGVLAPGAHWRERVVAYGRVVPGPTASAVPLAAGPNGTGMTPTPRAWTWAALMYHAVATNLSLSLPALFAFIAGRGAQEKTLAELKGEFALDVVPTRDDAANSAWQQLSILAHNVARSFQLDTLAEPKPRSRKRTYAYLFRSMRTLRFLLIARAGRLTRIGGRQALRLVANPATETLYGRIAQRLAA